MALLDGRGPGAPGAGAAAVWQALAAGRWSIVERLERAGRRVLIARCNEPGQVAARALTPRERQVVGYAALGQSNKQIAYELGRATSTVASQLARASVKLGVRSRVELVQLVRALRPVGGTEPP